MDICICINDEGLLFLHRYSTIFEDEVLKDSVLPSLGSISLVDLHTLFSTLVSLQFQQLRYVQGIRSILWIFGGEAQWEWGGGGYSLISQTLDSCGGRVWLSSYPQLVSAHSAVLLSYPQNWGY